MGDEGNVKDSERRDRMFLMIVEYVVLVIRKRRKNERKKRG